MAKPPHPKQPKSFKPYPYRMGVVGPMFPPEQRRAYVKRLLDRTDPLYERRDTEQVDRAIRRRALKPGAISDPRAFTEAEVRDAALSLLDDRETTRTFRSTATGDDLDRAFRENSFVAGLACLTEHPVYRSALQTALTTPAGSQPRWTDRERQSMVAVDNFVTAHARAQGESTGAVGGFAVSPSLDPSVTMSDYASTNIWARLCRLIDTGSNEWRTVASPAPNWAIKGEAAAATDASMTSIAQVRIPLYAASGFVEYSRAVAEDWPAFADNITAALTEGYSALILRELSVGTGVNEPTGIVAAMAANAATTLVTASTTGAITDADITTVWQELPARFRERATWVANASVAGQIRQHSGLYHAGAVAIDNTVAASEVLMSRQFVENSYLPEFTTGTSAALRLVVADWSQFVFVRRAGGMRVETVQTMMDRASGNRPRDTRAFLAYARIGSDVLTPNAFRTLSVT